MYENIVQKDMIKFYEAIFAQKKREKINKLTAAAFGLTNSKACLLIACRAALGAYPGWGGGAGGKGTSDLPLVAICTRRTAINFIS